MDGLRLTTLLAAGAVTLTSADVPCPRPDRTPRMSQPALRHEEA